MIEHINSFLLLSKHSLELLITFITNTEYYSCYKYSDGFRNNQLNKLEKEENSEVIKSK